MRSRRRRPRADAQPAESSPLVRLRLAALDLDPGTAGFHSTPELPRIFGAVMDTSYPNGTATLVVLVDGTTSLYTTSGFGIIGGGSHPSVVRASRAFLSALEAHLDRFGDDPGNDLPASGWVVMHALTYTGRHAIEAREDELGRGRHPLSPMFFAAQQVIAALRSIDQQRSP